MDISRFLDINIIIEEFHLQKDYLEILETHIAQVKKSRKDWLQNNASNFESEDEYYSAQENVWFSDLHGDRLRKSFLINLMSWLEWWTTLQCEYFKNAKGAPSYNRKRSNETQLQHNKMYILKIKELDVEKDFEDSQKSTEPPGWDSVNQAWYLRNCIVHNNGVIDLCKQKETLQKLIDSRPDLHITKTPKDTVFIKKGFCEWLLGESEQFAYWSYF